MSARNTIVLRGNLEEKYDEGRVDADLVGKILPGMMIAVTADGEYVPHGDDEAFDEILVAVEDDFRGMTVEGDLPSDGVVAGGAAVGYVAGDLIRFHRAQMGDELQMLLAASQSADPSKFATSNGDGKLKVVSSTMPRLFKFSETLVTAGGETKFVSVRVL